MNMRIPFVISSKSMKIASDKNGTCIIRQYEDEINRILKSLDINNVDLTSVDRVNQFKNQIKKAKFIWHKFKIKLKYHYFLYI